MLIVAESFPTLVFSIFQVFYDKHFLFYSGKNNYFIKKDEAHLV